MKVIDRWQTQHGSWDVKASNRWGIDQAHRDKYLAGRDIPGAGADHHILVKARPGTAFDFTTDDGKDEKYFGGQIDESGWVNFPMFAGDEKNPGAVYHPDNGEKGPWQVWVGGGMVADGIGLPNGEHVSTFLVIGEGTDTETPPTPGKDVYTIYRNEVLLARFEA